MKWRIGVECGQRWWSLDSWRRTWRGVRRFEGVEGFALGPIMFFKKGK